ncbi:GSCOCG00011034001-RA-CDS [Cotesia congregata]|nr:GSCOCG00011034001-RA-CDS [Cotesia congregata]
MIIYSPRIFQAVLTGFAEYRFFKWNRKITALFLLFNAFWQYCSTRTLENTLEASLMTITLSIFPLKNKNEHGSKFLWLVGFMFFIKPTSAIICAPLCLYHICYCGKTINQLIRDYFFIFGIVSVIAIAIDSYCYGQFVITPWEFFKVNVLTGVANYYEAKSIIWYLRFTILYFLLVKIILVPIVINKLSSQPITSEKLLVSVFIIMWSITIYSILPDKEHHYLLPLLPSLLIYVVMYFDYREYVSEIEEKFIAVIMIGVNIWIFYICASNLRGSAQIMSYLREEIANSPSDVDVMFLTPCYSTPFYSHVHQNISMDFLHCEPNLQNQDKYMNEADIFFKNPKAWLRKRYTNSTLPSLVVMYDNLAPHIKDFIDNYHLVVSVFDSPYPSINAGNNFSLYKLKYKTSSI